MNAPLPDPDDVRMRGFARRTTVAEAWAWLDGQVRALGNEMVCVAQAAGRVLAAGIVSAVNVPGFDRSMMDGFALHAAATLGASAYNRMPLEIIGQSLPGRPFPGSLGPGQAVRIMTGAPVPAGADAVLPAEYVEIVGNRVLAEGEVAPGKNIGRLGEDIAAGVQVLPPGRVLRPQDLGLLASIGVDQIAVVRRPRVRIVITGNELLPPGSMPQGFQIVDSNGIMLAALVARDGGEPVGEGIVPDEADAILAALRSDADIVLVSGGSSVGQEDLAPRLVQEHGRLAIHGIAMRPSSPTGMGTLDGRLVLLLPGNPVSCLCAYDFFAGRAIRQLGGRAAGWPHRRLRAPLGRKVVSAVGRLDYLRVRLSAGEVEPLAIAGASVLSSTTRADGFVIIPPDSEGYPPGTEVEVLLYD
ncbi:MAG: molybdopterin molybdotransferase MoeA [Thermoguttaceae bacterium]|nr:molybdopterin molybdotransferase MoeA [Thermoguttaceae bacterium]